MPEFKSVLSPEELMKRRSARSARVDLTPYLEYLQNIKPGYAGDLEILPGEKKSTIKRRVTMAANRLGKTIRYLRSGENELIFEVVSEQT
ncbi:MAG: hypothetical protein IRY83_14970, partial [Chloroflexi bacterium]|nr:hypothetical protein [Chloroflexota bacterium]